MFSTREENENSINRWNQEKLIPGHFHGIDDIPHAHTHKDYDDDKQKYMRRQCQFVYIFIYEREQ